MASSSTDSNGSLWQRQPGYLKDGVCLFLLLVLALAYFGPVVFGDQGVYPSDSVNWRSSAEAMIEYEEEAGELALWAPNVFGGMPGYLIKTPPVVPQLDDLTHLFRQIAWPASHLFVLMAGMYWLVFYLTRNRWSGLLSGVGFGFTTFLMVSLAAGHNTKYIALAFAPYLVLAFLYTLRKPKLLSGLLLAAAFALNLRAKHPQITYNVLFLMLIWYVVAWVSEVRSGTWKKMLRPSAYMAVGAVLGLLMVAQPYLSIYEYKDYSVRGAGEVTAVEEATGGTGGGGGGLGWEYAMRWSHGPGEMVTYLIADAYGGGNNTYWGPKPFTAGPHYLGGLIVALALLALWRVRRREVIALGIGAGLLSLFAMGEHVPWLNRPFFAYFPYFDAFRTPEIWLATVALALAALAGFGLAYIAGDVGEESSAEERTWALIKVGGGVTVLVALLWVGGDALFSFQKENEVQRFQQAIAQQNQINPSNPKVRQAAEQYLAKVKTDRRQELEDDAFRTLVVLVLGIAVLWLYRREQIPYWAAAFGVLVIATVDLWGVDRRYLGEEQFQPESSLEQQVPTYSWDRWIEKQVEQAGGPGRFRTLPLALNPTNYAPSSYHYESTGGYHGAKLQIYQDYIDHLLFPGQGMGRPNENALDLMSTRYVIARQQLPGTQVAYRDQQNNMLVLENQDVLPRAFLVGRTEVVSGAEETWQRIRSSDWDPRETALLPREIGFEPTPIDSASTAEVEIQRFGPREIVYRVRTDAPRLLVASEVYYPAGWEAQVGGEPAPVHRVNYLLRGIPVPEGEHTVRMAFDPASHVWGVRISWAATLFVYGGIVVLVGLPYWRRRSGGVAAEPEDSGEGEGEEADD